MGFNLKNYKKYWTFTVSDEEVYHIKKPDIDLYQDLISSLTDVKNDMEGLDYSPENAKKLIKIAEDSRIIIEVFTLKILNNNIEGKKMDREWLKANDIDFYVQNAICTEYQNFCNGVMNDPN